MNKFYFPTKSPTDARRFKWCFTTMEMLHKRPRLRIWDSILWPSKSRVNLTQFKWVLPRERYEPNAYSIPKQPFVAIEKAIIFQLLLRPSSFFFSVYRRPTDPNFWHFGVPGPTIPRLLVIFFRFFFSIRPTDPISGNALDGKQRKKGDGLRGNQTSMF